jgi:hypothetical protein
MSYHPFDDTEQETARIIAGDAPAEQPPEAEPESLGPNALVKNTCQNETDDLTLLLSPGALVSVLV